MCASSPCSVPSSVGGGKGCREAGPTGQYCVLPEVQTSHGGPRRPQPEQGSASLSQEQWAPVLVFRISVTTLSLLLLEPRPSPASVWTKGCLSGHPSWRKLQHTALSWKVL